MSSYTDGPMRLDTYKERYQNKPGDASGQRSYTTGATTRNQDDNDAVLYGLAGGVIGYAIGSSGSALDTSIDCDNNIDCGGGESGGAGASGGYE